MAKNIEWYYVDASRSQQGPKTIKELRALWTSQTIKGDTLVWCEGQPGWSAIDTLKDLKEQISLLLSILLKENSDVDSQLENETSENIKSFTKAAS